MSTLVQAAESGGAAEDPNSQNSHSGTPTVITLGPKVVNAVDPSGLSQRDIMPPLRPVLPQAPSLGILQIQEFSHL